jgi:NTP pyrophosphatase (non-canonical NTP hydrolase)
MDVVATLQDRLREFAAQRDWEHFHTPKNLSMALAGEAGELLEVFQWVSDQESTQPTVDDLRLAREELADIGIYLLRLADVLNIDLLEAIDEKIALNEEKYPVNLSRGNAMKYNRR